MFLGVRPSSQNEGLNEGLGSKNEGLGSKNEGLASKMKVCAIPGLPKWRSGLSLGYPWAIPVRKNN